MELENEKPKKVIIFGVEPKTIDWGLELSPELKEKMPQLIGLVLQEASIK
jgi:hydrogenase maturation protease